MGAIMEKRSKELEKKQFAGFGVRLLALILDIIVVNLIINSISAFSAGSVISNFIIDTKTGSAIPNLFLNNYQAIVQAIYSIVMIKYYGATLGKMALKISVTDKNGQLTWVSVIIRETIGKFISAILLGIGYLMVLWDHNKQGLHDKIADTYVVVESN